MPPPAPFQPLRSSEELTMRLKKSPRPSSRGAALGKTNNSACCSCGTPLRLNGPQLEQCRALRRHMNTVQQIIWICRQKIYSQSEPQKVRAGHHWGLLTLLTKERALTLSLARCCRAAFEAGPFPVSLVHARHSLQHAGNNRRTHHPVAPCIASIAQNPLELQDRGSEPPPTYGPAS